MASQATLRDLAADAGVSHTTVLRALNGHPAVADATRQRILDIVRRTGRRGARGNFGEPEDVKDRHHAMQDCDSRLWDL
ncbi:MAG: LacI family DNA-binding transcriptional regulator [Candidatus Competibacteraceae bacterium]|nr:LacI family DNA-binding transcriptional regulator [Candidatus Competibacteraceae bacterium]